MLGIQYAASVTNSIYSYSPTGNMEVIPYKAIKFLLKYLLAFNVYFPRGAGLDSKHSVAYINLSLFLLGGGIPGGNAGAPEEVIGGTVN